MTIPFPPSANLYWRHDRGVTHLSTEARKYRSLVERDCREAKVAPLTGEIAIKLDLYRPIRSGDLDNRIKQCLDACQGHLYINDSQIVAIHAHRHDDPRRPRCEVIVWQVPPQQASIFGD